MVGEEGPVAEVVFAERRRFEHAAELVELLQAIAGGPGETADRAQVACRGRLAIDG